MFKSVYWSNFTKTDMISLVVLISYDKDSLILMPKALEIFINYSSLRFLKPYSFFIVKTTMFERAANSACDIFLNFLIF